MSLQAWEKIDIKKNPTYVILDIGCTRCMGSHMAVDAFIKEAKHYGITAKWKDVTPR